jgi:queuine tRNA-ribosyltransferase
VRHLLATDEPTGRRLLTLHNVGWMLRFVDRMRQAIEDQRFEAFRRSVHETWGT